MNSPAKARVYPDQRISQESREWFQKEIKTYLAEGFSYSLKVHSLYVGPYTFRANSPQELAALYNDFLNEQES